MSLVEEYRRQWAWRDWSAVLETLPLAPAKLVLDLGCGPGDMAAEFARRGLRVIGVDQNSELLEAARRQQLASAEFLEHDLAGLPELPLADGIWCSFTAAYFPELTPILERWKRCLKRGGWIALTEIDNLFGHEPLEASTQSALSSFVRETFTSARYDFHMGSKLGSFLQQCGFRKVQNLALHDLELAFDGPASDAVVQAWSQRFDRLRSLQDQLGSGFASVKADFLHCLRSPEHRSTAAVYCSIAIA